MLDLAERGDPDNRVRVVTLDAGRPCWRLKLAARKTGHAQSRHGHISLAMRLIRTRNIVAKA